MMPNVVDQAMLSVLQATLYIYTGPDSTDV